MFTHHRFAEPGRGIRLGSAQPFRASSNDQLSLSCLLCLWRELPQQANKQTNNRICTHSWSWAVCSPCRAHIPGLIALSPQTVSGLSCGLAEVRLPRNLFPCIPEVRMLHEPD